MAKQRTNQRSIEKNKTVILRIFAKVFYDHQGFYGDDLKVAKLEKQLSKMGKYEEFKEKFEESYVTRDDGKRHSNQCKIRGTISYAHKWLCRIFRESVARSSVHSRSLSWGRVL